MAGEIEQPFNVNFQGDSVLSDSISFGRFETESLSWERRSSFSHNRYLEEVEKYSRPGSVNEKKAYFEAHFKKRGGLRGQNSAESYTIENGASEEVNQGTDIEIINMDNHNAPFDDCSDSPQNQWDHEVTEFEMSNPGISFPSPKFETSFSSVGGSIYGALNDVNEINAEGDSGENQFSIFVGDEPEVEIKQKTNNIEMNKNVPSEAMESSPKTDPVKNAGKSCSGSQQADSVKAISKRETKASKSQGNIHQSRRNISGSALKSLEKVSNKSKGEPPRMIRTEVHSSKTATFRTHAVRRTPKAEDSNVLKGKAILESRSGEKVQTSGVSYSSPSKLESRSYRKTATRQHQTVNSAMQDTGKSTSASNFRNTDLAERRKQGKPDAEIRRLQKNLDIRSKPIPSSYGAVRPALDGKKAVFSGTKVRNTLRKSTAAGLSSHSQLRKDIDSSASEAPNTSKNTSCHSATHVEACENSSISSANQELFLAEAASETENKRKKDQVKEKEPNVHKSRVSENFRMSKQGVEGKQKVGVRRSMGLMGRRDIKGVAGSTMGRVAVGVTS